jgi:hypothetical protein
MISRIISEIERLLIFSADQKNASWAVRQNRFWRYKRKDNSIFILATVNFILQNQNLPEKYKVRIRKISEKIESFYPLYKNKDDSPTYNFYKTKPSQHFPFGMLMHHLDHFRLPDDIDDTAIIYLTKRNPESAKLKKHLKDFSDTIPSEKWHIKATSGEIYNTWFGKKMPKEQDVCAILNVLYFVFHNQFKLENIDLNSIQYLTNQIEYISKKPFLISRHYANSPLIFYHYARFMQKFKVKELEQKKSELIKLTLIKLSNEKVFLNRILMEIALLKWGIPRQKIEVDLESDWSKGFYSFIGAPLAPFKYANFISSKQFTHIFWKSELHEWALILEYEMFFA